MRTGSLILEPKERKMENFIKYPRTPHLPNSEAKTDDDKTLSSVKHFEGQEVVVTLKMDGENTSLYHNGSHARSTSSAYHESRTWVRNLQGQIAQDIPEHYRICGENLFAKHSIAYNDLTTYFMAFSVWMDKTCLSWDETLKFLQERKLETVPVIYRGIFNMKAIEAAFKAHSKDHEGYVVRLAKSFSYDEFGRSAAKFVRANHVQTDKHWSNQAIIKNNLKK